MLASLCIIHHQFHLGERTFDEVVASFNAVLKELIHLKTIGKVSLDVAFDRGMYDVTASGVLV